MTTRAIQGHSINEIMTLTGYDRRTVANRLQGVEPIGGDGRGKKYTLRQFIEACENRFRASMHKGEEGSLDPVYERARKDKELADKTALENRVRREELLEAEKVKKVWVNEVMNTRSKLLNLPSRMATLVAATTDPAEVNELLMGCVREILDELSHD
jgi:phage terminase Nu1 subunit (DNA packaging protein)